MNSLNAAYWSLRLVLPLFVVAASLPWIARIPSKRLRRGAAVALALATLLPNLAVAADCTWLRFLDGLVACPWIASPLVFAAQAAGLCFLLRKAGREPGALDWPRLALCMAATVTLVLAWTTHVNLDLRHSLSGARLQLEAGRIAYRESPPPASPDSNAAPVYVKLAARLFGPGGTLDDDVWELDPEGAFASISIELRAAVAQSAPALEMLREATRLPRCSFELPSDDELFALPPIASLIALSRALRLDARLQTAEGNLLGALEDISAALRLAEHIGQSPPMVMGLAAVIARGIPLAALPHILSASNLRAEDLAGFALPTTVSATDSFRRSTAMEEGYVLSVLGRACDGPLRLASVYSIESQSRLPRPGRELAEQLYFDEQVAGYRRAAARLRELCDLDPLELAARLESESTQRATLKYERGLFAHHLVSPLAGVWLSLWRDERTRELARFVLAAAAFRAEHGRYPLKLEELPGLPSSVGWEGDASFARFVCLDPLVQEFPLSMELPAKN